MISSIDKYTRNLMSPCNTCKKMKSFTEHCCNTYPKRDNIPPKIFSGIVIECPYYEPKEDIET